MVICLTDENKKSWQFQKGQSGNPSGRPKVDPEIKEILRAAAPDAARRLIELMDCDIEKITLQAAVAVLDRVIGKPEGFDKIELRDTGKKVIEFRWQE